MKKTAKRAAAALCCVLMCGIAGCAKDKEGAASYSYTIIRGSDGRPQQSRPAHGGSFQITLTPVTSAPTKDEEETVEYIHDYPYVYNANVTDTSNQDRYYSDFEWIDDARTLWTSELREKPWGSYDAEGAIAYGKEHWDDGQGLCADFLSRCVTAGGITEYTDSSTSIALQLLHSRLGFGQFVRYNKSDHTITLPDYARPGDVVQIYCSFEGVMIHSLLMVGTDEYGRLKAVCHNMRNSGTYAFVIDDLNDPCYDCLSETTEVFFYHFYRDDDSGLPEEVEKNRDIILWEESGYCVADEKYDRLAALEYAYNNPDDGLGYYGAMHTSDILKAGGLTVGYPNQSALFMQLLKSHLGQAYSLPVRKDRTVILPEQALAGDIGFFYCPYDGIMISSFIVSGNDETGRMITLSYDNLNDGEKPFKVDSKCVGCGDEIKEVVLYHFD